MVPFMKPAVMLAILAVSASAFTINPSRFRQYASCPAPAVAPLHISDENWPSDSSSEDLYTEEDISPDAVTVDVSTEPLTPAESMVSSVLDELPDGVTTTSVPSEQRARINESLLKLEALNPTESTARSPLLNGVWSLRYAAGYSEEWALPSPTRQLALFLYSGGYSPGLFALSLAQKLPSQIVDLGDLEISIARDQPRIQAKIIVKFLGRADSEIVVNAHLTVDSDVRLTETYESASVLGQSVDIPGQIQYSRDLYVTYVDEDVLIVRDASGVPEVLVRKEKVFKQNWGTEPDEIEDLMAPGEEELPSTD